MTGNEHADIILTPSDPDTYPVHEQEKLTGITSARIVNPVCGVQVWDERSEQWKPTSDTSRAIWLGRVSRMLRPGMEIHIERRTTTDRWSFVGRSRCIKKRHRKMNCLSV